MIRVENLDAGYGREVKLENISAAFPKNEITVIAGKNGCGKSTLLKVIAGLIKPMKGQVLLEKNNELLNLHTLSDKLRARQIAYLPQNRNIPNISAERMVLHGRFPYLEYPRRYHDKDYQIAAKAMKRCGIYELRNSNMAQLSGGERQKVYLAMALAQDTDTVLLDEPTTFLDITYQLELMNLMCELKQEGKTIIVVMHDLNAAFQMADQLIIMEKGQIQKIGNAEEIVQSGMIEKTFGVSAKFFTDERQRKQYYFERIGGFI